VYAEMLKAKLLKQGTTVWMVNTGWTGGPFGIGKRLSIQHTRKLLSEALSGKLHDAEFRVDPVFGFEVPNHCDGVPSQILDPANTWGTREEYFRKYDALAARFIENFKLLQDGCPQEVEAFGPKRLHNIAEAAKSCK